MPFPGAHRRASLLAVAFAVPIGATACARDDAPASSSPPASRPSVEQPPAAPASVVTTAAPASAVAQTDAGAPRPACGTKPHPDCPLQAWMKDNATPPLLGGDGPALAEALEKTASFAPPGYTNWVSISLDGARAARSLEIEAAKAACRACHDQYKQRYRGEMRDRPLGQE